MSVEEGILKNIPTLTLTLPSDMIASGSKDNISTSRNMNYEVSRLLCCACNKDMKIMNLQTHAGF